MFRNKMFGAAALMLVALLMIAACAPTAPAVPTSAPPTAASQATSAPEPTAAAPAATTAPADSGSLQIPEIEEGAFNVAFIYIGPHDDAGWTQAHDLGRQYVEENVEGVHTAYVELVPEGAEAEQVIRSLARKGFDAVIATSFGYMDPMATVAEEFPDTDFLHVSGYKTNGANFGNMFGGMETIKHIAGMIAGARAKADENPKVGYIATFPIPEEFRLGNAFALGVQKTCPECTMDVRWINTWHDPIKEKDAAASLFDAGAQVVMTGADTPANAEAAQERDKWAITYDFIGNCKLESCLTTMYWNWGPIYAADIQKMMDGTWKGGVEYFDVADGGLGLFGFMDGQTPQSGVPEDVIPMVKETLTKALAGDFDRFSVFTGPITDNKGNVVIPEGEKWDQCDVDQFAPPAVPENTACPAKYGNYWWNENVIAELPKLQ